jgi:ribosomal protein S18 acetylase RimI-like enzyme
LQISKVKEGARSQDELGGREMADITYRSAEAGDVHALAQIRASEPGAEEHWRTRIAGYIAGTHNPQKALPPRIVLVACDEGRVVGLIAGHLTQRYKCDGELQWIDVAVAYRRSGIATELLCRLAEWFSRRQAKQVCVNVDPENRVAVSFYARHGAMALNAHWLVWRDITALISDGVPPNY